MARVCQVSSNYVMSCKQETRADSTRNRAMLQSIWISN